MIKREDVVHVAKLARLKLSDAEVEDLTGKMGEILGYIEHLNSAPTDGVAATSMMAPEHDPLRDDVPVPSLEQEEILRNGPSVKQNHFAIPRVIG